MSSLFPRFSLVGGSVDNTCNIIYSDSALWLLSEVCALFLRSCMKTSLAGHGQLTAFMPSFDLIINALMVHNYHNYNKN